MTLVKETEQDGYRICVTPVEHYECTVYAPDGTLIAEFDDETSESAVFARGEAIAWTHAEDARAEEERAHRGTEG